MGGGVGGLGDSFGSQDDFALAWGHDGGEYGLDRECRGPGKVDRFRVEQPLDLKSVHHRDDRFRC